MQAQGKRKKRRQKKPVTLAEVDAFLASPVAKHYYSFSESNVKRRLIRMLFYLRAEVDRLQCQVTTQGDGPQKDADPQWVQRVAKKSFG